MGKEKKTKLFGEILLFPRKHGKAYPGDTYISEKYKASKMGNTYTGLMLWGVIFGCVADVYFLHETVMVAFNFSDKLFENPLSTLLAWFVAIAAVLPYLCIGTIVGKKIAEFKAFRKTADLVVAVLLALVVIFSLLSISLFRFSAELTTQLESASSEYQSDSTVQTISGSGSISDVQLDSADFVTAVSIMDIAADPLFYLTESDYAKKAVEVMLMVFIMFLTAVLCVLRALYSGDPVDEAVYRNAVSSLTADTALYDKTFSQYANNPETERDYEKREQEVDKRANESVAKLNIIASRLNGILDPQDAEDILKVLQLVKASK